MKDRQQNLAYKWEEQFLHWPGSYLTPKGATEIAKAIARLYSIPLPELAFVTKDNRNGKSLPSSYFPDEHKIVFRPRHMSALIVLHEMAHAVTDYILGPELEAHGPQWLGVYMFLMDRFHIAPTIALTASAKAVGLKFESKGITGPRSIRKKHKRLARLAKQSRL